VDNENLFHLLRILLDNNKPFHEVRKEAIEYTREHDVEKSVIMTVAGAANCRLDYELKGDGGMWTVFEETKNEGRNEGRIRDIIEMGIECGLSEEDILEKLQHKMNVSRQKAQEYFQEYATETA